MFFAFFGGLFVASAMQLEKSSWKSTRVETRKDWGRAIMLLTTSSRYGYIDHVGNSVLDVAIGYSKLNDRGMEVDFVTLSGGDAPLDSSGLEDYHGTDYENNCTRFLEFHTSSGTIKNTLKLDEVDYWNYNAIYVPGGLPAISEFASSKEIRKVIHEMYDACRLVITVGTGAMSLLNVTLSNGSYLVDGLSVSTATDADLKDTATSWVPSVSPQAGLIGNGAMVQDGTEKGQYSVANNLITGQNYKAIEKMFREFHKFDSADENTGRNNCANVGSCSHQAVRLSFSNISKVTQSNLNGGGPDAGIETLGYKNIIENVDGHMVNLRVTSDDYNSGHPEENGLEGNITIYGKVNMKQGTTSSLKFGLWTAPPGSVPVVLPSFYLSFYDVSTHTDSSSDMAGNYSISVSDHEAYFLTGDTSIDTTASTSEKSVFTATAEGSPPWLSSVMSNKELEQSVSILFTNKSEVTLNFTTWGGHGNRNIVFSGRTAPCRAEQEHLKWGR